MRRSAVTPVASPPKRRRPNPDAAQIPCLTYQTLLDQPSQAAAALAKSSCLLLTNLHASDLAALERCSSASLALLSTDACQDPALAVGASTQCGVILDPLRTQFHAASHHIEGTSTWPDDSFKAAYVGATEILLRIGQQLLRAVAPAAAAATASGVGGGTIVCVDTFYYPNSFPEEAADDPTTALLNYPAHDDPGLFTIGPCSVVTGLQLQDLTTGRWIEMDGEHGAAAAAASACCTNATTGEDVIAESQPTSTLLVLGNRMLEEISGDRAKIHRVVSTRVPRFSMKAHFTTRDKFDEGEDFYGSGFDIGQPLGGS